MRNPGAWTLALTLAFTLACGTGGGTPAPDLEKELDAAMKELDAIDEPGTAGDIEDAGADGMAGDEAGSDGPVDDLEPADPTAEGYEPDPNLQTGDDGDEVCCSKYTSGSSGARGGFEVMTRKSCLVWKTAIVVEPETCDGVGPSKSTTTAGGASRVGNGSRVPDRGGSRTRTSGGSRSNNSGSSGGGAVRGR